MDYLMSLEEKIIRQVHQSSKSKKAEVLATGLSRPPSDGSKYQYTLGDFAYVMRGIVTGDNEFFFMTSARAQELGIPDTLLVKAVGRMRDVQGQYFDPEDVCRLKTTGDQPDY